MRNATTCIRSTALCVLAVLLFPALTQADVISVPASLLLPAEHLVQYYTNGAAMYAPPVTAGDFVAPLLLPHGARIQNVILEAHDNTGGEFGGYVRVELVQFRFGTVSVICSCDTGLEAAPGDTRIVSSGGGWIVDNSEFSYGLGISMNNPTPLWNIAFFKMIIEYEPSVTAAPVQQTSVLGRVQTFPNPSSSRFSIQYQLAADAVISGRVHDMMGREVAVLQNGKQQAGPHVLQWNGRDGRGVQVASGSYAIVVETGNETISRKVVLIK